MEKGNDLPKASQLLRCNVRFKPKILTLQPSCCPFLVQLFPIVMGKAANWMMIGNLGKV